MKLSTCLSALLVGLSVSTASAALAAPEKETMQPAVKVAQAQQPADPQPSDPTPAPATTPAPAEEPAPKAEPTTTEPTQPAVSLGGSLGTPADTASASPAEAGKKKPERPWANSSIYSVLSMTTSTVFRAQQQYADPTVDSSIWLMPRYSINEAWQLRGRLIFSYEFTNSDTTVTKNEPRFSDTTLQLFYRKVPELATVKISPYVQVGVPTSPESRARTMVFSPGAGVSLSKTFEKVAGGEINIASLVGYSHPIYQSENSEVRGQRPYAFQCAGGGNCQDLLSGTMNPSDMIVYTLNIGGTWGKWNPALYYLGSSQWAYHPNNAATVPVAGGQQVNVVDPAGFDRTNVRQTSYFSAWLDYEVNSWLTPEVGYSLYRTTLTEDSTYGNPFFDRYQDMRVFLGASVNVDALIEKMTGAGDAKPGVERAKNTSPVLHY